jgi:putative exosortase-associated protein (TIGR04073 family)
MKLLLVTLLGAGFALTSLADIQDPPAADHGPTRKLGRGLSNMLYGWAEIPVTIGRINTNEGNAAAASYGVVRGTGRAFVRFGAGFYEALLWPNPSLPGNLFSRPAERHSVGSPRLRRVSTGTGERIEISLRARLLSRSLGRQGLMALNADDLAERIRPLFEENFSRFGELGAAVSIWQGEKSVLELQGGFRDAHGRRRGRARRSYFSGRRRRASGAPVYYMFCRSAASHWSGGLRSFGRRSRKAERRNHPGAVALAPGRSAALDESVDVVDYAAVVRALEKQKPLWAPGTAHGYHARTLAFSSMNSRGG